MKDNNPNNPQPQQNYQQPQPQQPQYQSQPQPNSIYTQPQPLIEKIKQPKILAVIAIVLLIGWILIGIPLFDSIFTPADDQDNTDKPVEDPCKTQETKITTLNKSLGNTNNLLSTCNSEKRKLDNNITDLNTALTNLTEDFNETDAGLTVCLQTKGKYFNEKEQLQEYLDDNIEHFNLLFCYDENWMRTAFDFNTTIQEKETYLNKCETDVQFWEGETKTAIRQKIDLNILYEGLNTNHIALQQDYNDSTNLIFDLNQLINSDFNIYNPTEVRQGLVDLNTTLCNYNSIYC